MGFFDGQHASPARRHSPSNRIDTSPCGLLCLGNSVRSRDGSGAFSNDPTIRNLASPFDRGPQRRSLPVSYTDELPGGALRG